MGSRVELSPNCRFLVAADSARSHSLFVASFAHVAVGMLAGRLHGKSVASTTCAGRTASEPAPLRPSLLSLLRGYGAVAGFALLAMLPDADVLLVALGHRGASHSLFFAVAVGVLVGLIARHLGARGVRTAIVAAIAVASHGLLDAVGEGGRGIPLLWPFCEQRFMSPWRVLPDAPRGLEFLSWSGVVNITVEFIFFLPFTAYSLWPRSRPGPVLTVLASSAAEPGLAKAPPPAAVAPACPAGLPDIEMSARALPRLRSSG
jgi:inner membrane protein